MNFNYICIAPIVLYYLVIVVNCANVQRAPPVITPQQYRYLGKVGDKMYFAEDSTSMTWERAYNLCNASNMDLASVETAEQSLFLARVLPVKSRGYWLSGREVLFHYFVYEWNEGGSLLDKTRFSPWVDTEVYRRCVSVDRAGNDGLLRAQSVLCSQSNHVLCTLHD